MSWSHWRTVIDSESGLEFLVNDSALWEVVDPRTEDEVESSEIGDSQQFLLRNFASQKTVLVDARRTA